MSRYTHLTEAELRLAVAEAVGDDRDILDVVRRRKEQKLRRQDG